MRAQALVYTQFSVETVGKLISNDVIVALERELGALREKNEILEEKFKLR